jgi:hypothetical protein
MAYPTTGVLDDFNRSNVGPPPSASWTQCYLGGAGMKVVSNAIVANGANGASDYWNVATFGANSEAYITMTTKNTGGNVATFWVSLRLASPTTSGIDGYQVEVITRDSANAVALIRIWKIVNNAFTQLGADIDTTINAGDSFGGEVTGTTTTTITAYRKASGGSWGAVANRTDSSSPITAAGNIETGTYESSVAFVLDNFGGGTVVSGTTYPSSVTGALTPAGALTKQDNKRLTGAITTLIGALAKQDQPKRTGALTPSGILTKQSQLPKIGMITPSGTLTKQTGLPRAGVIATITGALSKQTNKLFAGALSSIVGTLSRAISTTKTGSVATIAGALTKLAQVTRVGTVNLSGALAAVRSVLITLVGALMPSGVLWRETRKTETGTQVTSGGVTKQTSMTKTGGLTPSGVLAAMKSAIISLAGVLMLGGELRRETRTTKTGVLASSGVLATIRMAMLSLAGSVGMGGEVYKEIRKQVNGVAAVGGGLVKRIWKELGGLIGSIGSMVANLFPGGAGVGLVELQLPVRTFEFELTERSIDVMRLRTRRLELEMEVRDGGL